MIKKSFTAQKSDGRVYTPDFIVNNILDISDYVGEKIIRKHVIDNSCGDGAFLANIVNRYCKAAISLGYQPDTLCNDLSVFIHGIEIDKTECEKCIKNLNAVVLKYNLPAVNWDIICCDSLKAEKYNGKMDFVFGNPPYIRVHNLKDNLQNVKKLQFTKSGMTDLYIAFYEIGLRMLNSAGTLGYITPSSYFNSVAAKAMRQYLVKNNFIDKIVNLKHYQVFNAATYTAITVLKKSRNKNTADYYEYDERNERPIYIDALTDEDFFISDNFYFSDKHKLAELKKILSFKIKSHYVQVKNGFATLADNFFINDFDFGEYVIPVIKASTGKYAKCLFPYENGKPVPFEKLTANPKIEQYYLANTELLKRRNLQDGSCWYGFGRTQGINDVYRLKYALNTLIKTVDDIKLNRCPKGCGVYSGLYILTDITEAELKSILQSNEFVNYIAMLGKYKSGGYYTFSSKDLSCYLNYKYIQTRGNRNE